MTQQQKDKINLFCLELIAKGQNFGPNEFNFQELEKRLGGLDIESEVYFVAQFDYVRDWPFERKEI